MPEQMISWDIYEIIGGETPLIGVKLRGRLRKFSLDNNFNLLTENASDKENCVRLAVLSGKDVDLISRFILSISPDCRVSLVLSGVQNPVLSKMKVNDISRY